MEIRTIEKELLDSINETSPYVHYMKSSMWACFQSEVNQRTPLYLGMYDQEKLVGTAMVLLGSWGKYHYAYIPCGPNIDYTNKDLVQECFQTLKEYFQQQDITFLRIDPTVERVHRDIDGNLIDDGFSNEWVTDELIKLGYQHKGYGYAYDGSWNNRYTLIINLHKDIDIIVDRFSKPRKTTLNRHKINAITTHIGTRDDIPYVMQFEKMLAQQEGFEPHSKAFFESLYDAFGDHLSLYLTEMDISQAIQNLQNELQSKKYAKDLEAKQAKEKELSQLESMHKEYGNTIVIAAGIFIPVGNRSFDLYTYNHKSFQSFKPVDQLHYFAIQDMKSKGVLYYDMCGFSGVTDKKDPYYGLYSYKRSFGSTFTEYIGQFDYIYQLDQYNKYLKRYSFTRRVQRKLASMKNKK